VSEADLKSSLVSWKWLLRVAQISGALTFIGAISSVLANTLIFAMWGLSFASIATPSDILMSGINSLFFLIPIAMSIWLASSVAQIIHKRFDNFSGIPAFATPVFALIYCVIGGYFLLIINRDQPLWSGWLYLSICALFLYSIFAFWRSLVDRSMERSTRILVGMCALCLIQMSLLSIGRVGDRTQLVPAEARFCTGKSVIVWLGNESAVVRCEAELKYVIVNRSDLTLVASYTRISGK